MEMERLENLWLKFGDIPVNDDGDILEDFLHFEIGDNRFEVWEWFEGQNELFFVCYHV